MAYNLAYQGEFTNRRTNNVRLEIYQKDFVPPSITTISNKEIIAVSVGYPNGNESKYNTIIGAEANITLRVRIGSTITPETFLTDLYDEWKVLIYCDTMLVFAGFIEPSEGNYLMKDAPLQIDIKCTDGLGLLKGVDLAKVDGDNFLNTTPTLLEVVAGCLEKTNLDLPIRIYCSVFESSMEDREDDITKDMFQQSKLDYRTFLQNPTDFVDCYKALEIILTGGFSIYQWSGRWVISHRPELQSSIGPTLYYTDYDKDGVVVSGAQDTGVNIVVGLDQIQHPINLDQIISYQVPVKSVKQTYNYVVWPELPKNNLFERGTLIPGISGAVYEVDNNGDDTAVQIGTYTGYTIDDWNFGTQSNILPALHPALDSYYKKVTVNAFGDELNREIVINKSQTLTQVLQSDAIPVKIGDRLSLSFEYKLSFNQNLAPAAFRVEAIIIYIIPVGGGALWYWRDGAGISNLWRRNPSTTEGIYIEYAEDSDEKTKIYKSKSLESNPIPVDGIAYMQLMNVNDDSMPNSATFRNVKLEYIPFIAGGYLRANGDYWLTSQNRNLKDKIDEEIFISDSSKKVFKGSLLRSDGTTLTTPTWYRQGQAESKHFKELLNLGKYRHFYRRFRKIQGTFRGVKSTSVNFLGDFYPIGFHKHYAFIDNDAEKMYVFSPPTTIDYVAGTFNTTAIEALDSGNTVEGGVTPDQILNQLIFRINNTTESEWDSAGEAPSPGTPYFPPLAAAYNSTPRSFSVFLNDGHTVTATASDGGAGNSPSITEIYNADLGNVRWQIFQIGEDVEVGNLFTVTIYDHDVSFTANTPTVFVDENQNGDTHQFGYIF